MKWLLSFLKWLFVVPEKPNPEVRPMSWRLAKSLEELRNAVDRMAPNRNKASDGTIGDRAHAGRKSDHNPNADGVVTAFDITHDPANGCDCNVLADVLIADDRVKYIIWNRRIYNASIAPRWRNYSGGNPHTLHLHCSIKGEARHYDNVRPWVLKRTKPPEPSPVFPPMLREGDRGPWVGKLQHKLNAILHEAKQPTLYVDWIFGPKTALAVRRVQKAGKLVSDGIVGPYTWDLLGFRNVQ